MEWFGNGVFYCVKVGNNVTEGHLDKTMIADLFDLEHTIAADYLRGFEYPWETLPGLAEFVRLKGAL